MDDWKPIETAPKDGTVVLGFWGGRPGPVNYVGGDWWCDRDEFAVVPTHWMPLPNPPRLS